MEPADREVAVVGMDQVEHVGADERFDVETQNAFGHRARVDEPTVGVDDGHDVVRVADHRPEAGFVALEQCGHPVDGAGGSAAHDARRDDRQHDDGHQEEGREDPFGTHAPNVGISRSRP